MRKRLPAREKRCMPWKICSRVRTRTRAARTCQASCIADQWLRLLRGHAYQRRASERRDGAEAVRRRGLERGPFFTERERAALAWTEAVTLVSQEQVPDNVFEIARKEFSDKELVDLTMAVIAING